MLNSLKEIVSVDSKNKILSESREYLLSVPFFYFGDLVQGTKTVRKGGGVAFYCRDSYLVKMLVVSPCP